MTFSEYLGNVAAVVCLASWFGSMLGRERNNRIFEVATPFRNGNDRRTPTMGDDSAAFLDHTIFYLFRSGPTSRRTIGLSILLSLLVLASVLLYCHIWGIKAYHIDTFANVSLVREDGAVSSFFRPWTVHSLSDGGWLAAAIFVLLLADYLSFLQTYLLLRMAKVTSSISQILFVSWVDLAVSFFTSIFVISAIIMLLIMKIITSDLQFTTVLSPSSELSDPKKQSALRDLVPDSQTYGGAFSLVNIGASAVSSNQPFTDSEIATIVTTFRNPELSGILTDLGVNSLLHKGAWPIANESVLQNSGFCYTSPTIQNFRGRDFYLSPSGFRPVPLVASPGMQYFELAKLFGRNDLSELLFGSGFDMHTVSVDDTTSAVVEHLSPWLFITPRRAFSLISAAYSLGFERLQGFQSRLPSLDMEAVSLSSGTYCDLRNMIPIYAGKEFQFNLGAATSANRTDLEYSARFSNLVGEETGDYPTNASVTLCLNPGDDPNSSGAIKPSASPSACRGGFIEVPRVQELEPMKRLRAAQFAMLNGTHIVILPMVVGSIGLTLAFYLVLVCFLLSRSVIHATTKHAPRLGRIFDNDIFRDNCFCMIIVSPSFVVLTTCYLLQF
nr:hypothetical protein [uncultured Rhodopila sp.]